MGVNQITGEVLDMSISVSSHFIGVGGQDHMDPGVLLRVEKSR